MVLGLLAICFLGLQLIGLKLTMETKLKAAEWLDFLHRGGKVAHFWCANPQPTSTWFENTVADRKRAYGEAIAVHAEQYVSINPSSQIPPHNKAGNTDPRYISKQIEYIQCINVLHCEFDGKDWVKEGEAKPHLSPDYYDETTPDANRRALMKQAQGQAFYADPDTYKAMALAHVRDLAYAPTLIVDSGGGYHCYWYLRDTVFIDDTNRQAVIDVQHWWVLMNGGDVGVSDITRVYRVLGSQNMKPGWKGNYPTVTAIEYDPLLLYSYPMLAEIATDWVLAAQQTEQYRYEPAPIYQNGNGAQAGQVRERFNQRHGIADILQTHGYQLKYKAGSLARLVRPGGEKPSVTVLPADGVRPEIAVAHNTADPLFRDGKGHDAYSIEQTLRFSGDWKAAYIEAKKAVGLWEEQPVKKGQASRVSIDTSSNLQREKPESSTDSPTAKEESNYLLAESADDEGNAQCVNRLFAGRFCYTEAYNWMHYVGTHWETENAEAALDRAIIHTLKARRKAAVDAEAESIVKITKSNARIVQATKYNFRSLVVASASNFDNVPYLLNCRNGIIDLRTGTLHPRTELDTHFTYCLPLDYNPNASAGEWLTFLRAVVSGEGIVEYLQQCVGYAITGDTREECLFYVHGPTRSGKGTFINTILKAIGYPSCPLAKGVSFSTFTARREGDNQNFDLAPLKACRFVSASESDKRERMNEAKVKAITGNDPITASFKHKTPFTYIPQYKIWLVSNHPVNADVDDDAFWYRVRVIEFPNSFAGHEDNTLKARMSSPENLQGVLAWAVEGARQWYATGRLVTPSLVASATQAQRDASDYVAQWLDECCYANEGIWTASSAIYSNYERWCHQNGVEAKQQKGLTMALQRKGFGAEVKKVEGKTVRVIMGISLR